MENRVQESGIVGAVAVNYIDTYKLDPCIIRPVCGKCKSLATVQQIDRSKIGTGEYCSYACDLHKVNK